MRRRSCKKIDVETAVEYRRPLFEKTGLAVTADRSDDNLTNLEGMEGDFSFVAVGGCAVGLDCSNL